MNSNQGSIPNSSFHRQGMNHNDLLQLQESTHPSPEENGLVPIIAQLRWTVDRQSEFIDNLLSQMESNTVVEPLQMTNAAADPPHHAPMMQNVCFPIPSGTTQSSHRSTVAPSIMGSGACNQFDLAGNSHPVATSQVAALPTSALLNVEESREKQTESVRSSARPSKMGPTSMMGSTASGTQEKHLHQDLQPTMPPQDLFKNSIPITFGTKRNRVSCIEQLQTGEHGHSAGIMQYSRQDRDKSPSQPQVEIITPPISATRSLQTSVPQTIWPLKTDDSPRPHFTERPPLQYTTRNDTEENPLSADQHLAEVFKYLPDDADEHIEHFLKSLPLSGYPSNPTNDSFIEHGVERTSVLDVRFERIGSMCQELANMTDPSNPVNKPIQGSQNSTHCAKQNVEFSGNRRKMQPTKTFNYLIEEPNIFDETRDPHRFAGTTGILNQDNKLPEDTMGCSLNADEEATPQKDTSSRTWEELCVRLDLGNSERPNSGVEHGTHLIEAIPKSATVGNEYEHSTKFESPENLQSVREARESSSGSVSDPDSPIMLTCEICLTKCPDAFMRSDDRVRCHRCEVYRRSSHTERPKCVIEEEFPRRSRKCSNCKTTQCRQWRRDPEGGPLCSACGNYLKRKGVNRPKRIIRKYRKEHDPRGSSIKPRRMKRFKPEERLCTNCGTRNDCNWRAGRNGCCLCGPCWSYWYRRNTDRPSTLWSNNNSDTAWAGK